MARTSKNAAPAANLVVVAAPARRVSLKKPAATQGAPGDDLARTSAQRADLPGFARDNPERLAGDALRDLAHERGLARSELATMTDEKVREQLRYLISAAYHEA